jgi:phosphoserine phosphatase RsbU/P
MNRILIAEDDLTSRTLLRSMLMKWGYEVVVTEDGEAAWERMREEDGPRLAILDWMMPGLSGIELCRRLRAQERETADPRYLILLTSRSDRVDIVEGLQAGADDYVSKPFDPAELRARIDVGRRMLDLLKRVAEQEKLRGVIEMAGCVCHELNQPLQVVSGYAEMLMMDLSKDDPNHESLEHIRKGVDRIGVLTRKIMNIASYRSKDYGSGGLKIVDIDAVSVSDGSS